MATILQREVAKLKATNKSKSDKKDSHPIKTLQIVKTNYTSHPVDIPDDFLAPLEDPSSILVRRVDFANSDLPEYKKLFAVVLDNVLSQEECDQLIHLAELSAGGHGEKILVNNGWIPAMVNAGVGREFYAPDYRNSDRIVWDNNVLVQRIWDRMLQGEGIKEYLSKLEGEEYYPAVGDGATRRGERWVATKQGMNERMRFLQYSAGQYFRRHCDGTFETPDGLQRSFYTVHLYLNDSAQVLGLNTQEQRQEAIRKELREDQPGDLLFGGATTFHSHGDPDKRMDIDPKAGRVLVFQQRRLLHSGDDVVAGIKYTMRSDLMYEFEGGKDGDGDVIFG